MGFSLHDNWWKCSIFFCVHNDTREHYDVEALLISVTIIYCHCIYTSFPKRNDLKMSTVHFFVSSWNQNKTSLRHVAINAALLDVVQIVASGCKTEKNINILKGAQMKKTKLSVTDKWSARVGQVVAPERGRPLSWETVSNSLPFSSFYVLLANTADLTPHSGRLLRLWACEDVFWLPLSQAI